MRLYVKYILQPIDNKSRDKRELSVVKELGFDVLVCQLGTKNDRSIQYGFDVDTRTNKASSNVIVNKFRLLYRYFIIEPMYLRKIKPDYLSCHNIFALVIGWLSTWFVSKKQKPKLIYDAHEYEMGCNKKRSWIAKQSAGIMEKFLMRKCALSIIVNDSIADAVCVLHKIPMEERPVVVRNIANYFTIDRQVIQNTRQKLIKEFGLSKETFIVMYHGGICSGRGIENLIREIANTKDTVLILLGFVEGPSYLNILTKVAEENGICDRVKYHEGVVYNELWKYVGAADLGVIPTVAFCKNHYFMLPNKLFENIQSETPLLTSFYPEMSNIINKYDIGLCADPQEPGAFAKMIEKVRTDKKMYIRFKENIKLAKQELCWEKEKHVLIDAIKKIM